jgi:hypothetical protein
MNVKTLLIGILSAGLVFGASSAAYAHSPPGHGHAYWDDAPRDHRVYRPYRRPYWRQHRHRHHGYYPDTRYRSRIWYIPDHDDEHWGFTLFFRD